MTHFSWKSRYFELWNDSELHYGATDQNVNPQTSLGYIDLRKATSAENDERYIQTKYRVKEKEKVSNLR